MAHITTTIGKGSRGPIKISKEGWLFPKIIRTAESDEYRVPLKFKFHETKESQREEINLAVIKAFREKLDIFPLTGDEALKQTVLYPFTGRPRRFFEIFEDYTLNPR